MKKILIKIEYIGTNYSGWQIQPNAVTVQQLIQDVFRQICQIEITVNASSRTDAGVHAKGQVATLFIPDNMALDKLFKGVNSLLPKDISIIDMVEVAEEFNVRKAAKHKRYIYRVINSPVRRVFEQKTSLWKRKPLDLSKIEGCINDLVGTHNYSAFRGKGCQQPDPVKTITKTSVDTIRQDGYDMTTFSFEGSGFLKNMVRIMVGTLLDVAQGKLDANCIKQALATGDRSVSGLTAPPEGLILDTVFLDPDPFQTREMEDSQIS